MKWQYLVRQFLVTLTAEEAMDYLNIAGEEGWELVQISDDNRRYIFKQPMENSAHESS